jgi:hypothetical protein
MMECSIFDGGMEMMKRVFLPILFSLLCVPVFAGGFGLQADYNNFVGSHDVFQNLDGGNFGIGARVEAGSSLGVILSFDYYFVNQDFGDSKFYEGCGNLAYWFPTGGVRPYIGGGASLSRQTLKISDLLDTSKNEVGINILGGIKFVGPLSPFIEMRYVIYSGDESFPNRLVFTGGIVF